MVNKQNTKKQNSQAKESIKAAQKKKQKEQSQEVLYLTRV
jgi:hypothetical protein